MSTRLTNRVSKPMRKQNMERALSRIERELLVMINAAPVEVKADERVSAAGRVEFATESIRKLWRME